MSAPEIVSGPIVPVALDLTGAVTMTVREISRWRYRWQDEKELQAGLQEVLERLYMIDVEPEARLTPHDRVDFLCIVGGHRIGIEVKIAGSSETVARQLARYAPHVDALLLVTTRRRHTSVPTQLSGKPIVVVTIGGAA